MKEVLHTSGRNDNRCMEADVVVFRGDTMIKPASSSLRSPHTIRSRRSLGRNGTRFEPSSTSASRKRESSRLGGKDVFLTKLPQKSRRDQVYVYVSTAAPASLQAGRDLRDQTFLSQLDYLATSNAAFDSVWRSPLPTAKFMISSYDAFLRPLHMRLPVIGFGDSAVACDDGHSVGARILRRISERYSRGIHRDVHAKSQQHSLLQSRTLGDVDGDHSFTARIEQISVLFRHRGGGLSRTRV